MKQANKQLFIALVLGLAFCGAFAATSKKSQVASFLQAKADFIPNRCNASAGPIGYVYSEDELAYTDFAPVDTVYTEDELAYTDFGPIIDVTGAKYPACVCFWNGTCQFRDDKTTEQWCHEEQAASVNENERCPDLKGNSLHICPKATILIDPIYEPYPIVENSIDDPIMTIMPVGEPILIDDPIMTIMPVDEPAVIDDPIMTIMPVGKPILIDAEPAILVAAPEPAILVAAPSPVLELPEVIYDPAPTPVRATGTVEPAISVVQNAKNKKVNTQSAKPKKATNGCVCTEEGCKRQKITDASDACWNGANVVAVVEDGACPKSTACKLKAPEGAYKCTKADRKGDRMCPMYISQYGCVCYKDGTCSNQGTNSCSACFNKDVVSVFVGQDCNCI